MPNIISLGEAVIDFVPTESGVSLADVPGFYRRFGGAPANVAIGLAKLDSSAGFIGKVGQDSFGDFLETSFDSSGVDTTCLYRTDRANTTLAFVSLTEEGDREFIFYRDPGADELLKESEISEDYVRKAEVLHFGSITLTKKESREATFRALSYARKHDLMVSLDPNIRLNLWKDPTRAKELVQYLMKDVDILKLSLEEVKFLTGVDELEAGVDELFKFGPDLIIATLGSEGCLYKTVSD